MALAWEASHSNVSGGLSATGGGFALPLARVLAVDRVERAAFATGRLIGSSSEDALSSGSWRFRMRWDSETETAEGTVERAGALRLPLAAGLAILVDSGGVGGLSAKVGWGVGSMPNSIRRSWVCCLAFVLSSSTLSVVVFLSRCFRARPSYFSIKLALEGIWGDLLFQDIPFILLHGTLQRLHHLLLGEDTGGVVLDDFQDQIFDPASRADGALGLAERVGGQLGETRASRPLSLLGAPELNGVARVGDLVDQMLAEAVGADGVDGRGQFYLKGQRSNGGQVP